MNKPVEAKLLQDMLQVAQKAALAAGRVIRERLGCPESVENKSESDYVTDVDRQSEALIVEEIHQAFPDHHIVAEETSGGMLKPGFNWIVDPLDGTTNFINGWPHVAVSIGAWLDGREILGVILNPVVKEMFRAVEGGGAFLNNQPIRVRQRSNPKNALIATGFPFRRKEMIDPYLAAFRQIFNQIGDMRRAGSAALDLAYVAAGRLDGYWEIGLSMWDIAAGAAILREAGGVVTDFWGADRYLSTGHIVAASPDLHPLLLEAVETRLAPHLALP